MSEHRTGTIIRAAGNRLPVLFLFVAMVCSASAFASVFPRLQGQACSFPAGVYNAHQLGGGYDSLTFIATTAGEFRGVYRVLASEQGYNQPVVYQTWLDGQTADFKCHGDTVDAVLHGPDGRGLSLSLLWNRALSTLEISGAWVGPAIWPRWTTKSALRLAALGVVGYGAFYTWKNWKDVKAFHRGIRKILGYNDSVVINGRHYLTPFVELDYQGLTGEGLGLLRQAAFRYVFQQHLWDLTLPMAAGAASGVMSVAISNNSRYSLEGHGLRQIASSRVKACHIPAGVYRGQWHDVQQGVFELVIPVGQKNGRSWPQVSIFNGKEPTSTYHTEPWRFECHGCEILLDWEHSEPSSKGTFVAYYDKDVDRLIGAGAFKATGKSSFFLSNDSWHHFVIDNLPFGADDHFEVIEKETAEQAF